MQVSEAKGLAIFMWSLVNSFLVTIPLKVRTLILYCLKLMKTNETGYRTRGSNHR